ncbi:MAG: PIN domain-containing protein [Halobacteria archaeon]|nr:PIN domain-containing protein [Halobacteria archaeon]
MKLLDTTFLVDHQRGDEGVARFLEESEETNDVLVTSSVNLKEIAVGKILVETPTPGVDEVLSDFRWLEVEPFTESHALEAARIEAELRSSDDYDPDLAADILIAGVARSLNAPVVTRNSSDFGVFDGVETEAY